MARLPNEELFHVRHRQTIGYLAQLYRSGSSKFTLGRLMYAAA